MFDLNGLKGQFSIREFIVDFFGSLMPGVLFLCLLIPALIIPIVSATLIFLGIFEYGPLQSSGLFFGWIKETPTAFILSVFFIFLTGGYVIGTLFYRRDPKFPDYKSFLTIASKFKTDEDLENWVIRIRWKDIKHINDSYKSINWYKRPWYRSVKKRTIKELENYYDENGIPKPGVVVPNYIYDPKLINILTVDKSEVQFPYNNLRTYLEKRDLNELANMVTWSYEESMQKRSKTFINSMKISLLFKTPENTGTINKNEAHIRLNSSMWYASKTLFGVSLISLIGLLIVSAICYFGKITDNFNNLTFSIVMAAVLLIASIVMQRNSEKFLHYQRVREIFYVLETYQVSTNLPVIPT